jgi:hypothetical protein
MIREELTFINRDVKGDENRTAGQHELPRIPT